MWGSVSIGRRFCRWSPALLLGRSVSCGRAQASILAKGESATCGAPARRAGLMDGFLSFQFSEFACEPFFLAVLGVFGRVWIFFGRVLDGFWTGFYLYKVFILKGLDELDGF